MKNIKISKKDIKLLLIVLSLAFLWVSYYFVYSSNMKKADIINNNIDKLEIRHDDLQKKINDKDKIVKENNDLQRQYSQLLASYGNGTSDEKNVMFVKNLVDNTGLEVNSVAFKNLAFLFNGTNMVEKKSDDTNVKDADNELSKANGDNPTEANQIKVNAKKLEALKNLAGYKVTLNLTFRSTYESYKKCLEYLKNYPEKCNVGDVSLSYDTETGNISGTMSINMYHLIGEGVEYKAPEINNLSIGSKNVFGTIEVPSKQKQSEN